MLVKGFFILFPCLNIMYQFIGVFVMIQSLFITLFKTCTLKFV